MHFNRLTLFFVYCVLFIGLKLYKNYVGIHENLICLPLVCIFSRLHNTGIGRRTSCLVIITSSNCQDVTIVKTCTLPKYLSKCTYQYIQIFHLHCCIFLFLGQNWIERKCNLPLWMAKT